MPALAVDLTGVWAGRLTEPQGAKHDLIFHLKADGNKFSGTITGGPPTGEQQEIVNGTLDGDRLYFDIKTYDLQELSKTYLHISRARTRLQHVLLTHYLTLSFPEVERFSTAPAQ